jgi:hypothetical protein
MKIFPTGNREEENGKGEKNKVAKLIRIKEHGINRVGPAGTACPWGF